MSAFDDTISIKVPFETDFEGGIVGDVLIRIVERTGGEEVDIKLDGQGAHFKIGRTSLKLGVMDIQNCPFTMPARDKKALVDVDRVELERELRFCMKSIGNDVTHPEWCGVSFEVQGDDLILFAGYSQVLARSVVRAESLPAKFKRIILHEKFCKQIIDYPSAELELHNGHALLIDKSGVVVYGRAITGTGGVNLQEMVDVAMERAGKFAPLPNLNRILGRATVFEGDHLNMEVSVVKDSSGTKLRVVSEAGEGRLVDYSPVLKYRSADKDKEGKKADHPPIKVMTNAKHLLSAANFEEFTIGSNEIVLRDGDALLLVSVSDK